MKITMWVAFIVGLIETGANSWFLVQAIKNNDLRSAKKFHGDFPAFASYRAWLIKIIISLTLGALALAAALSIYQENASTVILSGLFAGSMLFVCIIQAIIYGKNHIPARISIILGLAIAALVYFHI